MQEYIEDMRRNNPVPGAMETAKLKKIVEKEWENLDRSTRQLFMQQYAGEIFRYESEVREYEAKYGPINKKESKQSPQITANARLDNELEAYSFLKNARGDTL